MPGTGSATATRLLTEARASLGPSTAADVLAMRLGEGPSPRLVASMRVGATVAVGAGSVLRTHREVWEFLNPAKTACAIVSRGVDGVDDYGSRGWTVVEVAIARGDRVTVDETKSVEAALSSALTWAEQ